MVVNRHDLADTRQRMRRKRLCRPGWFPSEAPAFLALGVPTEVFRATVYEEGAACDQEERG